VHCPTYSELKDKGLQKSIHDQINYQKSNVDGQVIELSIPGWENQWLFLRIKGPGWRNILKHACIIINQTHSNSVISQETLISRLFFPEKLI